MIANPPDYSTVSASIVPPMIGDLGIGPSLSISTTQNGTQYVSPGVTVGQAGVSVTATDGIIGGGFTANTPNGVNSFLSGTSITAMYANGLAVGGTLSPVTNQGTSSIAPEFGIGIGGFGLTVSYGMTMSELSQAAAAYGASQSSLHSTGDSSRI